MQDVHTFAQVFAERLLVVPDYQRGYSWEKRQWDDFLEDVDAMPEGRDHYTGTIVLHAQEGRAPMDAGGQALSVHHVVDGQQRLTTLVVLFDQLRRQLEAEGRTKLAEGIEIRFVRTKDINGEDLPKLRLNADLRELFERRVLGSGGGAITLVSERRLIGVRDHFAAYFVGQREERGEAYAEWLVRLYQKLSQRLKVTLFHVGDSSEVGLVFEVMNNRGKPLSELEKVKNYLLYSAAKLDLTGHDLDDEVNAAWSKVLRNLMSADLVRARDEDQLLRTHWLVAYDWKTRTWNGSQSIKERFDVRRWPATDHRALLHDLRSYVRTLGDVSLAFRDAQNPEHTDAFATFSNDPGARQRVRDASVRLHRMNVIAPFLPLLVAARRVAPEDAAGYLALVDGCEAVAFLAYRVAEKRSNTGESWLLKLAHRLWNGEVSVAGAAQEVRGIARYYCPPQTFERFFALDPKEPTDFYHWAIKYFLYEWETELGRRERKRVDVPWKQVVLAPKETSIEHILPQTPTDAYWTERFPDASERALLTHDLGNLCLTEDNSSYSNKAFPRKLGHAGADFPCYARSRFFQERALARWKDWTPEAVKQRREEMVLWARERWHVGQAEHVVDEEALAEEDALERSGA